MLQAWGVGPPPLNVPFSEQYPAIYDVVIQSLKQFSTQITPREITRANLEEILFPTGSTSPIGKLREIHSKMAWGNVNNKLLLNSHKDLAWQAVHEVLPTRAFLKKRECTRSAQCPRRWCGEDETVRHLFWECPFAKNVWGLLGHWLNVLCKEELTYESIMYGFLKVNWGRGGKCWWIMINCVKDALWRARNICVFKRYEIPERVAINCMVSLLKDYIIRTLFGECEENKRNIWKVPRKYLSICM